MNNWSCYLIQNGKATYVGVSLDPIRRLRQHNGEISGGAKYTKSRGSGWSHVCILSGFDKISSLQFEWAVKHCHPRNAHGLKNRIKKFLNVLNREKWTSNSIESCTLQLILSWYNNFYDDRDPELTLPNNVTEEVGECFKFFENIE